MATSADNVRTSITGAVYFAPAGTTVPTSSTAALNAAFVDLGYVSADGIESTIDKSTNAITAFQNADKVREMVTEASHSYTFTLIETKAEVIEAYFGGTLVGGQMDIVPSATTKGIFVIDIIDGDNAQRDVVYSGEIISVEAQTFANGEPVSYGVTLNAYPVSGVSATRYFSQFED